MKFVISRKKTIISMLIVMLLCLVGCSHVLVKLDDQMGAVNNDCKVVVIDKRPTDKIIFHKYVLEQTPSLPVILKSKICNLNKIIKQSDHGSQITIIIDNTTGKDVVGIANVILTMDISGTIKYNNSMQDIRTFTSIEGAFIGPKDLMVKAIDDFVLKVDKNL